jgi:hypothetical protein
MSLLYCVSSVFCFRICFILLLRGPVFLTTGIRAKGNSQEKKVPGSSGSNVGRLFISEGSIPTIGRNSKEAGGYER